MEKEITSEIFTQYDENGNIIEISRSDGYIIKFRYEDNDTEFRYDMYEKIYYDGVLIADNIYRYTLIDNNRIQERIEKVTPNNNQTIVDTIIYDNQGRELEISKTVNGKDSSKNRITHIYDDKNNIQVTTTSKGVIIRSLDKYNRKKSILTKENGKEEYKIYKYNDIEIDGNTYVECTGTNNYRAISDSKLFDKILFEYYGNENLQIIRKYKTINSKEYVVYLEHNHMVGDEHDTLVYPDTFIQSYKYNDKGLLIEDRKIEYKYNNMYLVTEYEYDDNENCIHQFSYYEKNKE